MKEKNKYIVVDIETTGLSPTDNVVTCICAKTSDADKFIQSSKNEMGLLSDFYTWLAKLKGEFTLVTKNGKCFDIPFLITRTMFTYFPVPVSREQMNVLNCPHIDLQEVTYRNVSLEAMLDILHLPNKTDKGINAIKLFDNEDYEKLESYCWNDVLVTENLFKQFLKQGNLLFTGEEYVWQR